VNSFTQLIQIDEFQVYCPARITPRLAFLNWGFHTVDQLETPESPQKLPGEGTVKLWQIIFPILAVFQFLSPIQAAERSKVVAHRGLLKHAPENTLPNFAACLQLRIGFELDVQRSKDGHLVCVHDDTVNRTTNGSGKVVDLTLAELKALDAGSWFSAEFTNVKIPTIDEVFKQISDSGQISVLIAVDLKGADLEIELDCVALAKKHRVLDQLLFIGRTIDLPDVQKRLKSADRRTHVAALANNKSELTAAIAAKNADWVYVRFVPSSEEIQRIQRAGKQTFIAGTTVSGIEKENWGAADSHGVTGILTDYPLELKSFLRDLK
jgi:glycerophosphoryl diester phosphodiesterase